MEHSRISPPGHQRPHAPSAGTEGSDDSAASTATGHEGFALLLAALDISEPQPAADVQWLAAQQPSENVPASSEQAVRGDAAQAGSLISPSQVRHPSALSSESAPTTAAFHGPAGNELAGQEGTSQPPVRGAWTLLQASLQRALVQTGTTLGSRLAPHNAAQPQASTATPALALAASVPSEAGTAVHDAANPLALPSASEHAPQQTQMPDAAQEASAQCSSPGQPAGAVGTAALHVPQEGQMPQTVHAGPGHSGEEPFGGQATFWMHPKNQRAELTLEEHGQMLEVKVTLTGDQAHVAFRSDHAQARQALDGDTAQLRDMLRSEGLQLAGVSVDTPQRQPGRDRPAKDSHEAERRIALHAARATISPPATAHALAQVANTPPKGGRAVDIFV